MGRLKHLLWGICLFFFLTAVASGQDQDESDRTTYSLIFQGDPIERALKQLVDSTAIDLIYDSRLLYGQAVYSISRNRLPEDILADILRNTDLDYVQLSSGTYMLIASPEHAPVYSSLTGTIYDRSTGQPLEGANIMLADASVGTASNSAGKFSIAPLLSGNYEVTITYVGYRPVRDTIRVPEMRPTSPHSFYLEARPVFVEPLLVTTLQPQMPHQADDGSEQVTDITGVSAGSYSGSPDAIRSLQSVMGTNFSLSMADLHIQGGSAGDHLVLLDGTPVYNPVSLGRLTGAFSPYAIDRITIHKAGFRASEGSRLSGMLNMQQEVPATSDPSLVVQSDPLNLNARANITTSLGDGASLNTMVATRGTLWRWYQKPSMDGTLEKWDNLDPLLVENLLANSSVASNFRALSHNSDIDFYDLHLRSRLKFNELHSTDLSLYQGKNYLQTRLLSHNANAESDVPDFMYTQDGYDWLNTVGSLQHNWLASPRLNATFRASFSRHRSVHHFAMANSDQLSPPPSSISEAGNELGQIVGSQAHTGDRSGITERALEAEFDYSLHPRHTLRFGMENRLTDYYFSLSDPFYHPTNIDQQLWLLTGFIEDGISVGTGTKLTVGSRFTLTPRTADLLIEPRISFQYDHPKTSLGYLATKISGGIYRQFTNQYDLTSIGPSAIVPSNRFWLPADFSTDIPKAYHLAGELMIEPAEQLTFRWESYYKWQPTLLTLNYHTLLESPLQEGDAYSTQQDIVTSARGYSYGSGLSLSYFFEEWQMETSLSYQYSVARHRIPNRYNERYVETPWNQPHKLSASMNWNLLPRTMATLRWQGIWGRSWAFKRAYYDYLTIHQNQTEFGDFSVTTPEDDYLPAYRQLDAGLSYTQPVGSSKIRMQLVIVNVMGRQNILEKQIVPSSDSQGNTSYSIRERRLPGMTPSFSLEVSF